MEQTNGCCAVNVFYLCYIGSERSTIVAIVVVIVVVAVPTAAASDVAILLFSGIYPEGDCCYSVSLEKD